MRSHLSSLLAALVVALLGLAGPIATRGAEQPYSVLINKTNGNLITPTNWFFLLSTNPAFATNVQAAASNSIHAATGALWSASLTMSNKTLLEASNAAYLGGAAYTLAATSGVWSAYLSASNLGYLSASNSAYTAGAAYSLAATSGVWSASLTASNLGFLAASNSAYTAGAAYTVAATNAAWSIHLLVSNATYWAASNAAVTAAAANTLSATQALAALTLPSLQMITVGILDKASKDAMVYSRQVEARGGPNLGTNGEANRLSVALDMVYRAVGESNLVDAGWFRVGQTITSGTNVPTLRNSGVFTNGGYAARGLFFNATNSRLSLTNYRDMRTNTFCIQFASRTNSYSYVWMYALTDPRGYSYSTASSLQEGGGVYGLATHNGTSWDLGDGIFSREFNPGSTEGYSEGLLGGQIQQVNAIVTVDGQSNTAAWVNGILGQVDTNSALPSTSCTTLTLGGETAGFYFFGGTIAQFWMFSTVLTSNQIVTVDAAMSLMSDEVPFVVQGDSISASFSTPGMRGIEWPQKMWEQLGSLTNRVITHNHAYNGRTVLSNSNETRASLWHRQASLQYPRAYYALLSGFNDINNGDYATNVYRCLSNTWVIARTNGYRVLAATLLPKGTNAVGWTLAQATEISSLNALIRGVTNNPSPPFDYLMDFSSVITDSGDTNQLYDGIHPTPAYKIKMGQLVGTNAALWMR